jgi:hypothetical protein
MANAMARDMPRLDALCPSFSMNLRAFIPDMEDRRKRLRNFG